MDELMERTNQFQWVSIAGMLASSTTALIGFWLQSIGYNLSTPLAAVIMMVFWAGIVLSFQISNGDLLSRT